MERPNYCSSISRVVKPWLALAICLSCLIGAARAQSDDPEVPAPATFSSEERMERAIQSVIDENRRLAEEIRILKEESIFRSRGEVVTVDETDSSTAPNPDSKSSVFQVGYDRGFEIRPRNPDDSPFSLRINNQNNFRYSGFSRTEPNWTDSAGNVNPISNSSNFLIPRGRLIFSGRAFVPDMTYLLNIDYNTVTSNPIGFRALVLSYQFSRALTVSVGQNKVPGSREWLASASVANEGPDRSMATTFFRPSLSQGIWFTGDITDDLHYHAMLSNGFNTLNLRPNQFNHRFCLSDSVWWEPLGEFGRGYPDLQAHQQPVIRIGGAYTYSLAQGSQDGESSAPENSALRLSDGTLISRLGAFAPGVTLQQYDISLAAFDLALKYRGFSASTEMYFQELSSLQGNGPIPVNAVRAYGGFFQGGYFVRPQEVEVYARTSFVTGAYGTGTEVGSGLNWFALKGQSNVRFTFDTTWLQNSPADQNRTGFVAGQNGFLFRTQVTTAF